MISKNRVLLADRDVDAATSTRDYLEKDGYIVFVAYDGPRGVAMARRERAAVLLLHPSLLKAEGVDLDHIWYGEPQVAVILLGAEVARQEQSMGVAGGCSDIDRSDGGAGEPRRPTQVLARVRPALREVRREVKQRTTKMRFGHLVIDRFRHEVRVGDRIVHLTPAEFRLLDTLASEAGRAFTRMELLGRVCGQDYEGLERTIDTHVKNLRAKIEPNPADPTYIETVYGVGYRFATDRSNGAPRICEDAGVRR